MTATLREFRPSDLEALYALDQVCFAPGIAYSREEISAFIRRPGTRSWIAEGGQEDKPELAGFVIAHCDRCRLGHIITLDVAPGWRRQAIGSRLMEAAESWMRRLGVSSVSLETAEDNLTAQSFYLRRGYQKMRRVENYYGAGAAAWLMSKSLGEETPD